MAAVRDVPARFGDLSEWVETIEELCGAHAPERRLLQAEVARLRRLLKENEEQQANAATAAERCGSASTQQHEALAHVSPPRGASAFFGNCAVDDS
ncbi:hypothetical protein DIPPA_34347 [Diplonema papillatum]|nr:hypothetical protein DIPPA_34347 [Diplonema papillatum]